jgi:hypothetical protein
LMDYGLRGTLPSRALVTRDSMVGVAKVSASKAGNAA